MRPLPRDWFRRYVWRRDLRRKVRDRATLARRRLSRDDLADIRRLLAHRTVRTVLDVGANVGYETDRYLRAFPTATVHAFEPAPAAFARLAAAYGDHPRVVLHEAAAGDHGGRTTLRIDDRVFAGGANSLLAHGPRFLADQAHARYREEAVDVVRLDEVCRSAGVDHVDLLKLDVEGAELLALAGADDLLVRGAIDVVDVEVRALPDFEGQPLIEDVLTALAGHGYRLYNLYGDAEAPMGQLLWANAVLLSEPFRRELTDHHGPEATRF